MATSPSSPTPPDQLSGVSFLKNEKPPTEFRSEDFFRRAVGRGRLFAALFGPLRRRFVQLNCDRPLFDVDGNDPGKVDSLRI